MAAAAAAEEEEEEEEQTGEQGGRRAPYQACRAAAVRRSSSWQRPANPGGSRDRPHGRKRGLGSRSIGPTYRSLLAVESVPVFASAQAVATIQTGARKHRAVDRTRTGVAGISNSTLQLGTQTSGSSVFLLPSLPPCATRASGFYRKGPV